MALMRAPWGLAARLLDTREREVDRRRIRKGNVKGRKWTKWHDSLEIGNKNWLSPV
jgi:hypothetical protein